MRLPPLARGGLVRAYGGAFAGYAHDELGFKTEMTYNLLNSEVSGKWGWHDGSGPMPPSAIDDLRELLAVTPSFRLMIAHGYSDMTTPYAASRYVLDHLLPSVEEERAQLRLYRGGHMFYTNPQSRKGVNRGRPHVICAAMNESVGNAQINKVAFVSNLIQPHERGSRRPQRR